MGWYSSPPAKGLIAAILPDRLMAWLKAYSTGRMSRLLKEWVLTSVYQAGIA